MEACEAGCSKRIWEAISMLPSRLRPMTYMSNPYVASEFSLFNRVLSIVSI